MPQPNFTLQTALSPAECIERLAKATTPMRGVVKVFPFTATMPVIAKIQVDEFELRKRPFFLYNDTAFAHCYGKFVPMGKGTHITGRFGLGKVWRAYLIMWTTFATLFSVPFFAATLIEIVGGSYQPYGWIGLVVPVAFVGVGLGFLLLPQRDERRQKFYLDFLKRTLQAEKFAQYS